MKYKKLAIFGAVVGIGLLAFGLYMHLKREIANALNYCYRITGIVPKKISKTLIDIDFYMKVRNKSKLNLIIKGYYFKIYINKIFVAESKNTTEQSMPADGVGQFVFNLTVNPVNIVNKKTILDLIKSGVIEGLINKTAAFTVDGEIYLKHSILPTFKLPIKETETWKEIITPSPDAEKCDV